MDETIGSTRKVRDTCATVLMIDPQTQRQLEAIKDRGAYIYKLYIHIVVERVKLWFTVTTIYVRGWQGAKLLSSRRSAGFGCVGRLGIHRGIGARGDSIPSMATGPGKETTFTLGSAVPTASGWTTSDISTSSRTQS